MTKPRDSKLAVLRELSLEENPIGLSELMKRLPAGFAERSVRRWLNELTEEGHVKKSGERRATRYQAVKNVQLPPQEARSCFREESEKAIARVRRPIGERQIVTYSDGWFESYDPDRDGYLSNVLREQLLSAGARAKNSDPAGTYAHQILNRLLIDLSYNSSRLEGNTYSLLDTERLLLEGVSAEGKLDQEKIMILNHKEAIRYLVNHASSLKIDVATVQTIHFLLSDGLLESEYSGKVRDHSVRIGGSTYIPIANQQRLALQLEAVTKQAACISNPFEQSLFLLIHISYLQAFADVNKRTARLCANIPLIINNLVPLSFNDVERDDYNSAVIALYELNDVRPIVDLYVYSYLRTCDAYTSVIQAVGFDRTRVVYRQQRREMIRAIIEKQLVGEQLEAYVTDRASELVPKEDVRAFIRSVEEDLELMDQSRVAGLGITPDQLQEWLEARRKE